MNSSSAIREYIKNIPYGEPFTTAKFRKLAKSDNIRQILRRLVKSGELKRVSRGLFIKIKKQQDNFSSLNPPIIDVIKSLASITGETITIQGAEAARMLGLSTQTPMQEIFYTNGNTRKFKIGNKTVKLKHVNPSLLIEPETIAGIVVSALQYLGRQNVNENVIKLIKNKISAENFSELLELRERMPAWMADKFFNYQKREQNEK